MAATLSEIRLPKWNEIDRFVKDPELLTSEILFLFLTLSNVFVMFKLFQDVIPFPVFVTAWQMGQGLVMAYILGEAGKEFPKLQYFPRVTLDMDLMQKLLIPTAIYCSMLALANVLLSLTPTIATFPVIVSLSVVLHHATRFLGCGEEYMPMRWQSIALLSAAFLIGLTDPSTISLQVLPVALLFAATSAAFRAGYLQKVLHMVNGKGNTLHNHQNALGACLLTVLFFLLGEYRVFANMPYDPLSLHTYQVWGCLVAVGALPFAKNIVSNRLIRRTGQAPWRFLELASIVLVFIVGLTFRLPGWQGFIAILLVIFGRGLGAADVIIAQATADMGETRGGGAEGKYELSEITVPAEDQLDITTPYESA